MRRLILPTLSLAAIIAFAGPTAHAQVPGDQLISNSDASQFTKDPNTGYNYVADWNCTNYPRINRRCVYDPTAGAIGLWSRDAGYTLTARMTYPVNPTWWQQVNVVSAGTYELRVSAFKVKPQNFTFERPDQAVKITVDGKSFELPMSSMVNGAANNSNEWVFAVPVTAGLKTVTVGLKYAVNSYQMGHFFYVNNITLTYVSP